jgi:hypothetical protein
MARAELEDKWVVDAEMDRVRRRVEKFLDETGMTWEEGTPDEFQATQGSQLKTRLLGGWFVSPQSLPKRAVVRLKQVERGVRVSAVIEESMGFGFLDPILKEKYEKYFECWLDDLMDATEARR